MPVNKNMNVNTRIENMHNLELKHETTMHQADMIVRDEEARRYRLRALLLRDEKAVLQDQLTQKNTDMDALMTKCQQLENDLRQNKEMTRKQEMQIKGQARDLSMLQTELQSLSTVSQDSAKVLTEKLALSREVNLLRPELEHLKSQLSHQQSVVAEKLALERQLNSVEVELEAEKRAKQRALQREAGDEQDELRAKVQDLERKLAAEKRDKEQVRKEGEKALSEATAQVENLEQRLDLIKSKLRETREELKRCKAQLDETRSASTTVSDLTEKTMAISIPTAGKQGKKRRVDDMMAEVAIGTPGVEQRNKRPVKKRGLDLTLVGEKSNFSITPFLNKTKIIDDLSPEADDKEDDDEAAKELDKAGEAGGGASSGVHKVFQFTAGSAAAKTQAEEPEPPAEAKKQKKATPNPRGRPRKVLGEMSTAKKNSLVSPAPHSKAAVKSATKSAVKATGGDQTKTLQIDSGLEKVAEEAGEEAQDQENQDALKAKKPAKGARKAPVQKLKVARISSDSSAASIAEPKKKKRKLVGGPNKTLFDDEDVGQPEAAPTTTALKRVPKAQLGVARPLTKTACPLPVQQNAFSDKTTFTPLKRARRGMHASFLA